MEITTLIGFFLIMYLLIGLMSKHDFQILSMVLYLVTVGFYVFCFIKAVLYIIEGLLI